MYNITSLPYNILVNFAWSIWYILLIWALIKAFGVFTTLISNVIINYTTVKFQKGVNKLMKNVIPKRRFRMDWMIDREEGHCFDMTEKANLAENDVNVYYKSVSFIKFIKTLLKIGHWEYQVSLISRNSQNFYLRFYHLKMLSIKLFSNSINLVSIPISCENVDHLAVVVPTITNDCLQFLKKFKLVKEIDIDGLYESKTVINDLMKTISMLPMLQELHLPYHKSMRPTKILEAVNATKFLMLLVIRFDDRQSDSMDFVREKFEDACESIPLEQGSVMDINVEENAILISRISMVHVMLLGMNMDK